MKRLFFLVPTLQITEQMTHEMSVNGISEDNIHVVGKNSNKIKKAKLHEANLLQTSDLIPSLKRGAKIGIFFSIFLFLFYIFILPANYEISFFLVAVIAIFGPILGAWISSLIGVSVVDPIVEKFEKYIKEGHYIMVVDPTTTTDVELANRVIRHYNGVQIAT